MRTSGVHTSVPAVTSVNAAGVPRVTTCSGSRPDTLSSVYCQPPAHIGASVTVTWAVREITSSARTSATTLEAAGYPAQATGYAGPKLGTALAEGDRDGVAEALGRVDGVGDQDVLALGTGCSGASAGPVSGMTAQPASANNSIPARPPIARHTIPPSKLTRQRSIR